MLQIQVENQQQSLKLTDEAGPLEFGRFSGTPGVKRLDGRIWVTLVDDYVSREQLRLEVVTSSRIAVTNLSKRVIIDIPPRHAVAPGERVEIQLPARLVVGKTIISVQEPEEDTPLMTVMQPVHFKDLPRNLPLANLSQVPDAATLLHWFETIIAVQRAAAGSSAFYEETARAVVELVGLDFGIVLLRDSGGWQTAASWSVDPAIRVNFSQRILDHLIKERRTFFQLPDLNPSHSLSEVSSVVASPVFDSETDEVVGAVYGARTSARNGLHVDIKPLEAQVVQVLAAAVAAGLARVEVESQAARQHILFEQFFSPELARALDRDPSLLAGRDREISVLFADLRGFSRIAEKLTASLTCDLVESIMDRLTLRIREHEGVLVTYLGDGLLAMWNAPLDQPDHRTLACRAGLALLNEMPALNAQWGARLGETLRLGVGINTGQAMVGNTGSRYKLHYGPLGHTVNLASRVEGATKQLGVPMLITNATRQFLGKGFATRRLSGVKAVGLTDSVDLYELQPGTIDADWLARRDIYEAALAYFEAAEFAKTCALLEPRLSAGDEDLALRMLWERSRQYVEHPPKDFDPALELGAK